MCKDKTFTRICPECGTEFDTSTHDRQFCSDQHKAAFHNRSSKIGRALVPLAQAWREGRNVKGKTPEALAKKASAARALNEMCALLDRACADDRAEDRTRKLDYLRRRWGQEGTLAKEERVSWQERRENARAAKAADARNAYQLKKDAKTADAVARKKG